jgi:hypothetical protein
MWGLSLRKAQSWVVKREDLLGPIHPVQFFALPSMKASLGHLRYRCTVEPSVSLALWCDQ